MTRDLPTEYEELSPEEAAQVDATCDGFEQAWKTVPEGGPVPEIAGYLERCTEQARTVLLHELIALDRAYQLRFGVRGAGTPPTPSEHWPSLPGLELLEVLGSGGMGVVYKARQPALDRDVAVKLLLDAHLGGSGQRERFLVEARAVAKLQHPNLVQVYEFGEIPSAGGTKTQPYLVLEYVPGGSLADLLRASVLPPRDAARLVETLAEAIDFAHKQGVIHRDLKPANVLLVSSGVASGEWSGTKTNGSTRHPPLTTHQPKITDFGLAKFLTGSDLTRTGDVLGTPSYMAPEQTTGKHGVVTSAVDVYGLGAVLYECLTGRPPFRAETAVATVLQVQHEEPVPPRRLQPTVPRDLETICLKCLQKESSRRYASASALADDLRRFQAGESIRARPVGNGERVVRWCRRKPMVAGLLGALVVVFLGGLSGVLWQWQLARHHAAVAERNAEDYKRERDSARLEHERAERHLRRVREKMDWLTELGRNLWQKPQTYKTGKALLEQVLAFYQDILPEEGTDPQVRLETARLYYQVAEIQRFLGQWDKAIETYRRQADLLTSLLADDPTNVAYRRQLAASHRFRGFVHNDQAKMAEALAAYADAAKLYEQLLQETPGETDIQAELANTLLNTAVSLSTKDNRDEIERIYTRMMELNRAIVKAAPDRTGFQSELALGLEGQVVFLLATGRAAKALDMAREVLAIRQRLLARGDLGNTYVRYVARAHSNLARVLYALGHLGAEQSYREAIGLMEKAMKESPDTPFFRSTLADALAGLASILKDPSRQEEVEQLRRHVIGIAESLAEDFPEENEHRRRLVDSYMQLAFLFEQTARYAQATEQASKALERDPELPAANNSMAWYLATNPNTRLRDTARAVQFAEKAVAGNQNAGNYWNTLGVAHFRNGNDRAAIAALEKSRLLRNGGDSFDSFFLALAHARLGNREQARDWFDRAVKWMDKNQPQDHELQRFRAEAEAVLGEGRKP